MSFDKVCGRPLLVAFGNPLLDICIVGPETEDICKEFGLSLDGEAEVSSTVAEQLQERTKSLPKVQRCGGSALNTTRVLNWLLGCDSTVVFSGSIGKDDNGALVRELTANDGVVPKFAEHPDLPTGVVTVLVQKEHRSLVAYIGAAQEYKQNLSDELLNDIRASKILVLEAYFVMHNSNVAWEAVNECHKSGICVVFLLSSVYVYENPSTDLLNLVQSAHIVLGNEREYRALEKSIGRQSTDLSDVLHSIVNWGELREHKVPLKLKQMQNKGKVVICTRGKDSTVCYEQTSGASITVPVTPVLDIVDGTGAGDSFASGVLLGVLLDKDSLTCIQLGTYASSEILKQVGCALPEHAALTKDPESRVGALLN